MGTVLNTEDFEAARTVRAAKLNELGIAPVCMAPGAADDGHSHTVVEEVVIVQSGEGKIQIENETFDLCAGSVAVVPAGQFHALCNTGATNFEAVIIYNSNVDRKDIDFKTRKQHFGEDDTSVAQMKGEVAELRKTVKKLRKKLKSK